MKPYIIIRGSILTRATGYPVGWAIRYDSGWWESCALCADLSPRVTTRTRTEGAEWVWRQWLATPLGREGVR